MFVSWRSTAGGEDVVLELLIRLVEHHYVVIRLLQLLVLVVVAGGAGPAALHVLHLGPGLGPATAAPADHHEQEDGGGEEASGHDGDDDLSGEERLGDHQLDSLD